MDELEYLERWFVMLLLEFYVMKEVGCPVVMMLSCDKISSADLELPKLASGASGVGRDNLKSLNE